MSNELKIVAEGLNVAFETLNRIAARKGHTISAVTINTQQSDLSRGLIVGNCSVNNRSRRNFKLEKVSDGVQIEFLSEKQKIAA